MNLGNSTILKYCTKIKAIFDILSNIGSLVPARNLVLYALNGLPSKYSHIIPTIRYSKPFPRFLEMRSMLALEERNILKEEKWALQSSHGDTSSSPIVLATEHQSRPTKNATIILVETVVLVVTVGRIVVVAEEVGVAHSAMVMALLISPMAWELQFLGMCISRSSEVFFPL